MSKLDGSEAEGFAITARRHRFEAASRLRMPEAPCVVVTEDDLNAELAMIDENLCRTDMTVTFDGTEGYDGAGFLALSDSSLH